MTDTELIGGEEPSRHNTIAPPVAAGSVDTLQRFEMVESQHGTGYMVHWDKALEEDADGEWVKHADAIAWGAQQREAGWVAGRINGAKVFDKTESAVLAAAKRLLRDTVIRAEKAEARVKELEEQATARLPFKPEPCGIVGSGPNAKEGDRPCWTPDCGTF